VNKKNTFMQKTQGLGMLLILLLCMPAAAMAMETEDCLACHTEADYVGEDLSIDADSFMHTAHANFGCTTCHNSVTDEHPYGGETSPALSCDLCHSEVADTYQQTTHANYASCIDCHDPHSAQGLQSTSSQAMNAPCFQCHDRDDTIEEHSEWLPQTALHVAKVPCITCHTATEDYLVVLQIDRVQSQEDSTQTPAADYDELKEISGDQQVAQLIDVDRDNLVSLTELRDFMLNPAYEQLTISGTLVPKESSHNLAVQESRYDCTFCHASGTQSMQTSYLALPNQDGSVVRLEVEEGAIVDTLYGTPDFYLTGSSRNSTLDIIGLIILCGGFIMPVGHGTLRLLTHKNRKH
jgi:predicted CXXCH cytochrome family protein